MPGLPPGPPWRVLLTASTRTLAGDSPPLGLGGRTPKAPMSGNSANTCRCRKLKYTDERRHQRLGLHHIIRGVDH
jgi:hypothetical protein